MEMCGIDHARGWRRPPPRQRDGKQYHMDATHILKVYLRSDEQEMRSVIPDILEFENHRVGADSNNKPLDCVSKNLDSLGAGTLPGTVKPLAQHVPLVDEKVLNNLKRVTIANSHNYFDDDDSVHSYASEPYVLGSYVADLGIKADDEIISGVYPREAWTTVTNKQNDLKTRIFTPVRVVTDWTVE